ncbi:hypothetical protein GCM10027515_01340 [Schumannella luteola]|uniref:ABC-2 type transport system ATP-binding protein n=1 Tax=Schumannella luteola TaxID=472059 RepID=A0A852Y6Y9_9MICO|nr:ABC transporter ATP-binding protein [Schumannella luteola]NYG98726.1 ABC-2 type transport system ATP-binding protein [Schumannella luteola]TPX04310.1 ABC transporter ATP-binding protein [Schumannella luteola]
MTETTAPEVVRLDDVRKAFVVRKDNTLKDRVLTFARARRHRTSYTAADGISLSIHAGTTVGLLGANGSGKSTLLKLIGGILSPDSGSVQIRGRIAALLELGAGFHPDLSGRENVYLNATLLGLSRSEIDERFDDIVEFSGIREFIDNEVKFYSSGMFMRLAFAVAVHTDPDILLVDEVLAVGDEAFQRKCMDKIRSFQREGRTIILVSHAAAQIQELCDTTFVLDSGAVAFAGDTLEGLGVLRDLLERDRRADAAAAAAAAGTPIEDEDDDEAESRVQVVKATVFDAEGNETTKVRQGSSVTLRLHLTANGDVDDWMTGFGIDTPNGQMVLGTSTDRLKAPATSHRAGDTWDVDFDIEELNFGVGDYFINARAEDFAEGTSSILWQAALLHVSGSESSVGTVAARVTTRESATS